MHDKLIANIETRRSGAKVIKFSGVLDEHNHLNQIAEKFSRGSVVVLNVAGIERINSTGVRDWVDWLALLDVMGVKPVLVSCSPAFVAQMNRIKNFAGNAIVKSFEVPYVCSTCRRESNVLLQVADVKSLTKAPAAACEMCGNQMRFTDDAAVYFAFVRDVRESGRHAHREIDAELARGSETNITPERDVDVAVIESTPPPSAPRVLRRSVAMRVMSARPFSTPMRRFDDRPWLLGIIAVLLCAVVVLLVVAVKK